MSVETLEVNTTNYTLEVTNGTTQTLEVTEGITLDLLLSEMGLQGPAGPPGRNVTSITKTSTVGLVDTYTILYSDSTTETFTITNGANGSGSVSSVGLSVPTGLSVTNSPVTTSGVIEIDFDAGYSLPTNAKQAVWDGKQDALVSGTNIKSINSNSLLGTGNITTGDVTLTGIETLSNKTLTGVILNDGYTEEVFTVTGTTPALSPTDGSIQTWVLSGNSTPTAGTWASGQSITLMVDDGSAYSITWSSLAVTWKTNSGTSPALNTTGYTVIVLWKVGSTIYGARVGDA